MPDKKPKPKANLLDLSQFSSVDDAVNKMVAADSTYRQLAKRVVEATWPNLHSITLFLLSAIKRSTGLHRGVIDGVRESNPHATFPLLRCYVELLILVAYVLRKPDYIRAVMNDPAEWEPGMPKRKGTQALIGIAEQEFPTISEPYDELSDMGHFGTTAMWMAFTPTEIGEHVVNDKSRGIEWTNVPSWRDPSDPLKAAAHLLEFTQGFAQVVEKIIEAHLVPLKPDDEEPHHDTVPTAGNS